MKRFFLNWHIIRFFRLALGVFLIFQAFETHQWIFLGFAIFFLFQAFFNIGCSSNTCQIQLEYKKSNDSFPKHYK
ncbi:hypothetical protein [Flavobacterium columnare]|uniref:DUF2892 domain-containing protein n=1 Tax=Flavobacterium columnare TaxID=996 RepID=A0AAI8CG82_9FLAO|nr:hypothetical protein [Flavobacterium columnare]AMO19593.1 hypothetical protein UN65_03870 [Flavobacterium columnare]AUX17523.1 hypothetical protein AQ623_03970 [Flavobacterium columnare]MEB3800359.1 hypothetical protein [Flavobacterium columnare]QOG56578.1 hypothetical protein HUE29_03930 [Flavobacterium columnare]QOG59303.1 hypothetical protein HUE30_03935 [Flavobacterium columnare]